MSINFEFESTFKNINNAFLNIICRSLLIWLATSFLASCFHAITETIGLRLDEFMLLSLLFSLPALLFLIPNFYILNIVVGKNNRILYSFISVLMLCLLVVALLLTLANGYFEKEMLYRLLLPYIVSAEISFFLFTRNVILIKH